MCNDTVGGFLAIERKKMEQRRSLRPMQGRNTLRRTGVIAMVSTQTSKLFHCIRTLALHQSDATTDGNLLDLYVRQKQGTAFEALVRRHARMVLGVCRRVLGNSHDAEDAFQATFLVLVRKAASIRPSGMVGNWLYGVAHRTAPEARRSIAKRRAKEAQVARRTERPEDALAELWPLLDQELPRLPDKYRAVLVLCDLEGRTRKESRPTTRPAGRHHCEPPEQGKNHAGEAIDPSWSDALQWGLGGGYRPGGGVSLCATFAGVGHSQGCQGLCGRTGGGCRSSLGSGRRINGRSAENHVIVQLEDRRLVAGRDRFSRGGVGNYRTWAKDQPAIQGGQQQVAQADLKQDEKPLQGNPIRSSDDLRGKWTGEKNGVKVDLTFNGEQAPWQAHWQVAFAKARKPENPQQSPTVGVDIGAALRCVADVKAGRLSLYLPAYLGDTKEIKQSSHNGLRPVGQVQRGAEGTLRLHIIPTGYENLAPRLTIILPWRASSFIMCPNRRRKGGKRPTRRSHRIRTRQDKSWTWCVKGFKHARLPGAKEASLRKRMPETNGTVNRNANPGLGLRRAGGCHVGNGTLLLVCWQWKLVEDPWHFFRWALSGH